MDKQFLENCLKQGMSSRQIAKLKEVNIGARTIVWYIHKYNLTQYMNYKKPQYNEDYFNKIDTNLKPTVLNNHAGHYVNNTCKIQIGVPSGWRLNNAIPEFWMAFK